MVSAPLVCKENILPRYLLLSCLVFRQETLLSQLLDFPIKPNVITGTKTLCWHGAKYRPITTLFCSYSEIICYFPFIDRTSFYSLTAISRIVFVGTMAIEGKNLKFDPNTEAFQMRAQLKKMENCRKQWFERWSWLLEESQ